MSLSATPTLPASHPPKSATPAATDSAFAWLGVFQSVQLAIILLSLLALGVFVGVIIPQAGLVEEFQLKTQYGQWYTPMRAMGLFNVYSSPWFIAIEVLFFFNLLFGSFQWLRPAWRAATRRTFCAPENILASAQPSVLPLSNMDITAAASTLQQLLKKRGYWVHTAPSSNIHLIKLYAHKANFSRLGPVVAHFGILLLLVASVYGAFTGFKAQQMMSPGETASFTTLDSFTPNLPAPWWQGSKPNWQLVLHDFDIEFYAKDPTTPKQYISDLEIRSGDGQISLARQKVSVNHPLSLGDVMFYQASFAPTGRFFLQVDGQPLTAEVNTTFNDRPIAMVPVGQANENRALVVFPFFVQKDAGVERNHLRVFLHEGATFANKQPGQMPPNLTLFEGQSGHLLTNAGTPVNVTFDHPEIATGFQIKKAPETPWVYLAFGIISLGAVMCFFSQRQLWVAVTNKIGDASGNTAGQPTLYLAYKTKKARFSFQKERCQLESALQQALAPKGRWAQQTPPVDEE